MNDFEMYTDVILEYYKNPVNYGEIIKPTIHFHENNPTCGDVIDIYILFDKNKIKDVKFKGKGCAISVATSSMLTEKLMGKDVDYLKKMNKDDVIKMLGIEISPARMKCALLSLRAAKQGLLKYLIEKKESVNKDDFRVYE